MFMSLISHILSAWFAFLLPSYFTFKALSHRPLAEPELSRWAMYWVVVGTFLSLEYLAEWLVSWMPFYWELKTGFLLFLALPHTQGSTYIYTAFLQPFFVTHEADLDASIAGLQDNAFVFMQQQLSCLLNFLCRLLPNNNQHRPRDVALNSEQGYSWMPSTDSAWNTYTAISERLFSSSEGNSAVAQLSDNHPACSSSGISPSPSFPEPYLYG